ncbi:MAG: hypothetical protein EBU66_19525, partial [Bacteroidetes bacterium]|nr:hypothetical protein [Bacteroidota bacterium]
MLTRRPKSAPAKIKTPTPKTDFFTALPMGIPELIVKSLKPNDLRNLSEVNKSVYRLIKAMDIDTLPKEMIDGFKIYSQKQPPNFKIIASTSPYSYLKKKQLNCGDIYFSTYDNDVFIIDFMLSIEDIKDIYKYFDY